MFRKTLVSLGQMKSRGPVSSTHEVLRLLLLEQASGCPERQVGLHAMPCATKTITCFVLNGNPVHESIEPI